MIHKKKEVPVGFTIIEVMLALFITAILVTILSIVFNTGLRAYRQGKDLLEIARKAQLVMGTITSELSGAIIPTANVTFTNVGMSNAVFFMAPVDNSSALDLCEIGYYRDSSTNTLRRYFVTANSSAYEYPSSVSYDPSNSSLSDTFCEGVINFELDYYDGTNWSGTWSNTSQLPQMVEIKLEIQGEYPKNAPVQKKEFITRVYLPNSTNN